MRKKFDEELRHLNNLLLEMSMLIESSIKKAISLLDEKDEKVAEEVSDYEERIDVYEGIIQKQCLRLFVEQQPAAGDLRRVSAALKMITDMERIGDNARDIAEICMVLPDDYDTNRFPLVKQMAEATINIVNNSIDSFVNLDIDSANKINEEDDEVDNYFVMIRDELIDIIKSDFDPAAAIDFIMIAKYLERIADHAVNIAQWVIFSIEG
ncbi:MULTISPECIES: phosphate signaling complex protein PhoU [Peptoniphilus]|jgi:phosphate transport system regulatory protein phoU|uniref:phosphate signaling complex protein PhoU n=1 Tax=Peptoniphilus TaxID=162289 RepID=UPI0002884FB6|nr:MULTISPECIES: phosphate signaling complex protein PhoU [Peptoniphilus]MBS6610344.1 phosphate signaling complex protein PhoU [Peptoniphilus harei]MDU1043627.1 phosphate signaling complex protein PhoU [Peptoniphilus rhinitidis]MDU1954544.1 phosphate signaling complex protein PhoU [Peptoniphilus lacydonensis]MDU2109283.1 phosphate signaling complex protein PhoU [Peptoniphilus lacydonensis]MDU2115413.1 phosphate signaling complex protein PhoU [Peptoniphilus lacydonensis]